MTLEMIPEHLVNVPVASTASEFFELFRLPNFAAVTKPLVWQTAFVIAIVASLETLLCVEATDKLDPQKRVTPTNLELKAQGVGNIVSGLIGGLPITQVIVRSSANIQSGGKTKLSAIIHGLFILLFVAFLPAVLNLIPRASLAAILLMVGYKLAKPTLFKSMWKQGLAQFLPFIITIFFIIFKDLLWGVAIGLVVAIFEILYLNFKKPYLVDIDTDKDDNIFRFTLAEDVTFIHKASIQDTLNKVPSGSFVTIDGSRTVSMHPDVLEIIQDYRVHAMHLNIKVELVKLEKWTSPDPVADFEEAVRDIENKK